MPLREMVTDAIRYWEPRRLVYNGALALIFLAYFVTALPDSASRVTFNGILFMFSLAVLANVLYCTVYLVDVFAQLSGYRTLWLRYRLLLLLVGIAFAGVITRSFGIVFFHPANF